MVDSYLIRLWFDFEPCSDWGEPILPAHIAAPTARFGEQRSAVSPGPDSRHLKSIEPKRDPISSNVDDRSEYCAAKNDDGSAATPL
jgi:hypothetical protein